MPQLPPELVSHIIVLALPPVHVSVPLQPRYDLLLTLCRVNRTWRALAQPHFFTHVEYISATDRLGRLRRAVDGNEELAALAGRARVVRLGATDPLTNEVKHWGEDAKGFMRLFKLHPNISTLWLAASTSPSVSDLVPFQHLEMIHSEEPMDRLDFDVPTPLPSIGHLSLQTFSGADLELLVQSPLSAFPNIHSLTLIGQHYIGPTFPTTPTSLTAAITTLVLMTTTREYSNNLRDHLLPLFSSVENLHLGYWGERIDFLERVASLATTRLRSLTLEWHCAEDHEILQALDMAVLGELEYLKLNYYEGYDDVEQGSDEVRAKCRERGIELVDRWWTE